MKKVPRFEETLDCLVSFTFTFVLLSCCYYITICYSNSMRSIRSESRLNKECKIDINCAGISESPNARYYCNEFSRRCILCEEKDWDSILGKCWNDFGMQDFSWWSDIVWVATLIKVLIALAVFGVIPLFCFCCICCPGYMYIRERQEAVRIQQQWNNALSVVGTAAVPTALPSTTFGHGGVTANGVMGYGSGNGMHTYTASPPPYDFSQKENY